LAKKTTKLFALGKVAEHVIKAGWNQKTAQMVNLRALADLGAQP
jgi:hypothetical protein